MAKKTEGKGGNKLNLERMTREYFFPDIIHGVPEKISIPTTKELKFLGLYAIDDIRDHLRDQEKLLSQTKAEIVEGMTKLQELMKDDCVKMEFQHCDWHGSGYLRITDDERQSKKAFDMLRERSKQVHSCQFGRQVAVWCSMTPKCSDGAGCLKSDDTMYCLNDNYDHDAYRVAPVIECQHTTIQCPHYAVCQGVTPFAKQECVFSKNAKVVKDCMEYLESLQRENVARSEFMEKYLHNVTAALHACEAGYVSDKPSLELNGLHAIGCARNDRVISIARGWPSLKIETITVESLASALGGRSYTQDLVRMPDGQLVAMSATDQADLGGVYLLERDFIYLIKHLRYRRVWLELVQCNGRGGITKDDLKYVFNHVTFLTKK